MYNNLLGRERSMVTKPIVELKWTRYDDFFHLYQEKADIPKLVYVIGEFRLVYVGCVGARGGKKGLSRRYDKPYVERAKSIFGSSTPSNQPAYVGEFNKPRDPDGPIISNVERIIQKAFDDKHGQEARTFTPKGKVTSMKLKNHGECPSFLPNEIDA